MDLENQEVEDQAPEQTEQQELEAQRLAVFNAAFDGKPTEPPPADDEPQEQEQAQPEPEYAQITKEEHQKLLAAAAKIAEIEAAQSKSFGTIGGTIRGLQERLEKRLAEVSAGSAPAFEISDEDIAEVEDLSPAYARTLRALKAAKPVQVDPDQLARSAEERLTPRLEQVRQEALTTARRELREELLADQHPDWRDVTSGAEFAQFAREKGQGFMTELAAASTEWNHRFIGKALTEFKQAKAKAASAASTRRDRIASNVNPRGTTAPANPAKTREEAFLEGWNSSP